MDDLNGHHQKWLGSTNTNRHGVAVSTLQRFPFVIGTTHERGGTLDLPMTDAPVLEQVTVVAPLGNSDHSIAEAVPNLCVSKKALLKLPAFCD